MNYKEINQKALEHLGIHNQQMKAIEEMAELTNALMRLRDGRCAEQDVITEIADVTIMMQQLALFFGQAQVDSEIRYKMYRLNGRLQEEKNVTSL